MTVILGGVTAALQRQSLPKLRKTRLRQLAEWLLLGTIVRRAAKWLGKLALISASAASGLALRNVTCQT